MVEPPKIIKLNVGGVLYHANRQTLLSVEDSFLAKLVDEDSPFHQPLCEAGDSFFIDRDGKLFRHVLNWLRDRVVIYMQDNVLQAQLLREADFFALPGMREALTVLPAPDKYIFVESTQCNDCHPNLFQG